MLELLIIKIIKQNHHVIFTINYIRAICLKIYDRLSNKKKIVFSFNYETISVEVKFYIL